MRAFFGQFGTVTNLRLGRWEMSDIVKQNVEQILIENHSFFPGQRRLGGHVGSHLWSSSTERWQRWVSSHWLLFFLIYGAHFLSSFLCSTVLMIRLWRSRWTTTSCLTDSLSAASYPRLEQRDPFVEKKTILDFTLAQERTSKAIFRGKVKEQKPPGKMAMWDQMQLIGSD